MTAVLDEAEALIRRADATTDRKLKTKDAELELADKRRQLEEAADERANARKAKDRKVKRIARRRKRLAKQRGRRATREAMRARFQTALAGRLVLLLVFCAVATAWYGQFRYLTAPAEQGGQGLILPFALAGASALEILGLAMGAIVRAAGEQRDRALRARLVMWAVICFSAWSNFHHNGVVLAALSILGPTAWEISEWWNRRAALHTSGKLLTRPVRPRFPMDQALLFPRWTLAAYRVAVRDRIEDPDRALELAKIERAQRKTFGRLNRRRFARSVRTSIESSSTLALAHLNAEREHVARLRADLEGTTAAAVVLGSDRGRELADSIEAVDSTDTAESTGDQRQETRRRRWRPSIRRRSIEAGESIENGSAESIDSTPVESIEATRSATAPIEHTSPVEPGQSTEAASIDSTDHAEETPEPTEGPESTERDGKPGRSIRTLLGRPNGRGKSFEELAAERDEYMAAEHLTASDLTAEGLRKRLGISWRRANELRQHAKNRNVTTDRAAA